MKMQKVDFVFEYEIKAREFNSVCLLAAYLQSKGYSVAVLNSWQSLYKKPPAYDAVVAVISACYNDGTYDFFTGHIAQFSKVLNLQWEQLIENHYYGSAKADGAYIYKGAGLVTPHICWGEREKEHLRSAFGIEEQYLKVLGYLPLDFYREELRSFLIPREKLFLKYGIDPKKKTLLFVSSFSVIGLPESEPKGRDEQSFATHLQVSIDTQTILLNWFSQLADNHPELQIVYRYHPAEKANMAVQALALEHENIYVIAEEPLNCWLSACDKLYNWYSSSMAEMLCTGKDTYLLRPVNLPFWDDIPIFEGANCIKSYDAFEQSAVEERMPAFPVPKEQVLQWYDITEEPAYRRIGDFLIELYHSDRYTSRPSAANMHGFTRYILKKELKSLLVHTGMDRLFARFGGCQLAKKMDRIRKGVISEDNYALAKRENGGYIQSRAQLNGASEREIQETIAEFRQRMAQ